jgi:hypothetical protein
VQVAAVACEIRPAEVIGENEHHVGFLRRARGPGRRKETAQDEGREEETSFGHGKSVRYIRGSAGFNAQPFAGGSGDLLAARSRRRVRLQSDSEWRSLRKRTRVLPSVDRGGRALSLSFVSAPAAANARSFRPGL